MFKYCHGDMSQLAEAEVVQRKYQQDRSEKKINLALDGFLSNLGYAWGLPVVRQTERNFSSQIDLDNIAYGPLGQEHFLKLYSEELLGSDSAAITENRLVTAQTISGNAAIWVIAHFLVKIMKYKFLYLPSDTVAHLRAIFVQAGMKFIKFFRYLDKKKFVLDIDGLLEDLGKAPQNSVVFLYTSANLPTGCDPDKTQWEMIADIVQERNLFLMLDCSYAGLVTGDMQTDCWAVRYLVERNLEIIFFSTVSFVFCVHNYQLAMLGIVVNDNSYVHPIASQLMCIIRALYAKPPHNGAKIIGNILSDRVLYGQWKDSLFAMAARLIMAREQLKSELTNLKVPGEWSYLTNSGGMFFTTNFTRRQIVHLYQKYHIYMCVAGYINICGVTTNNVQYIGHAIKQTLKKITT